VAARELAAKGYREVPRLEADFAVAYGAAVSVFLPNRPTDR
jgi:hypothetical protein